MPHRGTIQGSGGGYLVDLCAVTSVSVGWILETPVNQNAPARIAQGHEGCMQMHACTKRVSNQPVCGLPVCVCVFQSRWTSSASNGEKGFEFLVVPHECLLWECEVHCSQACIYHIPSRPWRMSLQSEPGNQLAMGRMVLQEARYFCCPCRPPSYWPTLASILMASGGQPITIGGQPLPPPCHCVNMQTGHEPL